MGDIINAWCNLCVDFFSKAWEKVFINFENIIMTKNFVIKWSLNLCEKCLEMHVNLNLMCVFPTSWPILEISLYKVFIFITSPWKRHFYE